jgi:hypothetical protein
VFGEFLGTRRPIRRRALPSYRCSEFSIVGRSDPDSPIGLDRLARSGRPVFFALRRRMHDLRRRLGHARSQFSRYGSDPSHALEKHLRPAVPGAQRFDRLTVNSLTILLASFPPGLNQPPHHACLAIRSLSYTNLCSRTVWVNARLPLRFARP